MKRLVAISLFVTVFSLSLLGQTHDSVKMLCENAVQAAQNGDFASAKLNYDEATDLISKSDDATLNLFISDELIEYIVTTLAQRDTTSAREYVIKALELRISCLSSCAQQGAFESVEEYVANVANEYLKFGGLLSDCRLVNDAEQCFLVAPALYKQSNIINDDYADILESIGFFYEKNKGNHILNIKFQYKALEARAHIYGIDSKECKETFKRLISTYAVYVAYLSFVGEPGLLNQWEDELPIPGYDDTKNMISAWNDIRNSIIDQYGRDSFDNLLQEAHIRINGDESIAFGTEESDCLYLGILNITNGRIAEYEKCYKTLLSIVDDSDIQMRYAEELASAVRNSHYVNYLISFYKTLKDRQLAANRKDNAELIDVYCGQLLYSIGSYDMAWVFCFDAADSVSNGKEPEFIVADNLVSKLLLASLLWDNDKHNPTASRKCLDAAKDFAESHLENIDSRRLINIYGNLSVAFSESGAYTKAEEYAQKAILLSNERSNNLGEDPSNPSSLMWPASQYASLAEIYTAQCNYSEAKKILNNCLKFYDTNYPESPKATFVHLLLMHIAENEGNAQELYYNAELLYRKSISSYIANAQAMTKSQRTDYWYNFDNGTLSNLLGLFSQQSMTYATMASLAYNAALVQKGFLLGQDEMIKNNVLKSRDDALIEAYHRFKEAERNSDQNKSRLENRMMYLYGKHPEFINSWKATTWEDVRSCLKENEISIEFTEATSRTGNTYGAIILGPDYSEPMFVPLGSEGELASIYNKQALAYIENDKLYNYVWKKLEPYLRGVKTIYFSPYGLLSQINIEVLKNDDGKQMNKKFKIERLSSTANLTQRKSAFASKTATLFGGLDYNTDTTTMVNRSRAYYTDSVRPVSSSISSEQLTRKGWSELPATKIEVERIEQILHAQKYETHTFMSDEGNEEAFKALSGKENTIMHIATHGFYLNQKQAKRTDITFMQTNAGDSHTYPLRRCGLIFSGGQHAWLGEDIPMETEDGILTAEEIAGMDLSNTDLLVLSACQTGLGDVTSEGVYGLQRGFKIAGVNSIIMSLWEVNDSATEVMMTKFYQNLAAGKSKRDSFNLAIEEVKKKYDSPECWAAFIMLD